MKTLKIKNILMAIVIMLAGLQMRAQDKVTEHNQKRFNKMHQISDLTEDQQKQLIKDAIKDEFTNYKFSGELNENRNYLYDELKQLDVEEKFKKVAWKHSIAEVKEEDRQLSKRGRANKEILKAKCIIRYKRKLVALIFDKFVSYEQLKSKLL